MIPSDILLLTTKIDDLAEEDREIILAICWQESNGNLKAIRYEESFYNRYCKNISKEELIRMGMQSNVSVPTERRLLSFSYGVMQIMGLTARSINYKSPLVDLLGINGLIWGIKYYKGLKKKYTGTSLETILSAYNAGSPSRENYTSYVLPVIDKIKQIREEGNKLWTRD